jgi:hypothetical protein
MSKDYNLKISIDKTKIMAFEGKHVIILIIIIIIMTLQ